MQRFRTMSAVTLKQILQTLADETGVSVYRTRDVTRTTLQTKYKNSDFACPEARSRRNPQGELVLEPIQVSFSRAACTQQHTLRQLRAQRDKFLRCALLRDWARQRGDISDVEHMPPLHAAWEYAQQCQECIVSRPLPQADFDHEDKLLGYITSARHEASSNNSEGRNFPRLRTRSNRSNAARRSKRPREHH